MAPKALKPDGSNPNPWQVKLVSARARKEWDLAKRIEPELMEAERIRLSEHPLDRGPNPRRTHRLQGGLASKQIGGQTLPQWQHELTGSGRIWYCPDVDARVIWVTKVSLNHPKETT